MHPGGSGWPGVRPRRRSKARRRAGARRPERSRARGPREVRRRPHRGLVPAATPSRPRRHPPRRDGRIPRTDRHAHLDPVALARRVLLAHHRVGPAGEWCAGHDPHRRPRLHSRGGDRARRDGTHHAESHWALCRCASEVFGPNGEPVHLGVGERRQGEPGDRIGGEHPAYGLVETDFLGGPGADPTENEIESFGNGDHASVFPYPADPGQTPAEPALPRAGLGRDLLSVRQTARTPAENAARIAQGNTCA